MADHGGKNEEGSNSPSEIRRGARSEGSLLKFDTAQFGSSSASEKKKLMRKRSFSTNDSDDLEERLKHNGPRSSSKRLSITEMLLGQRSFYSANESVFSQTVEEVSDSMENMSEEIVMISTENSSEGQTEAISQTDGNGASKSGQTKQQGQLGFPLFDTFLSRLSNIAGIGTPGTVNKNGNDQERSGEYSTVYSDDFLMDRIYRRMNSKKKEKQ